MSWPASRCRARGSALIWATVASVKVCICSVHSASRRGSVRQFSTMARSTGALCRHSCAPAVMPVRSAAAGSAGRAGDGAPDELGQDVVLAVEVEVEAAAGDAGRGEDVADGEVAERAVGEQPGGGGQDGLAQVRGVAAARGPAPVRPGRPGRPRWCRHAREPTRHRVYTYCLDSLYSVGMSTLTCHLVTRNQDAAAAWYTSVLGAT